MWYLLVEFSYKTSDFYGENENMMFDTLLYFYNTKEECELRYINTVKYLETKYNKTGGDEYLKNGIFHIELNKDDIIYDIAKVVVSQ